MPPTDERIRYATTRTTLGQLLVACSDAGICAVSLGNNDAELLAGLKSRFPRAQIEPANSAMEFPVEAIATIVEEPASARPDTLSLDMRGTPFQLSVWSALTEIEPGTTITYGELARRVGRPTAVRAVARACGANPVGVLVPCHRVIGADGSLTGYASGVERKAALLEREGVR
ncbi:MAG: methylated-DNA--[protein]-cysteine S-methyltransferase [Clostridiales bacterium]|nr:methylated-DNA--[protein]-cysteine S-methyltransferase [Clostridiales bacterium]